METQNEVKKLKKVFSAILIWFPILTMYASPIPILTNFTLGDLMLLIMFPVLVIWMMKKIISDKKYSFSILIIYLAYIIIQMLLTLVSDETINTNDVIFRTTRYSVYLSIIIFFSKQLFDYEFGIKLYKLTSVFSTFYLFVQVTLLRTMNYMLPGTLPFLTPIRNDLQVDTKILGMDMIMRPHSIFSEPAWYAVYVLGILIICLFSSDSDNDLKIPVIITVGILLSVSTTGILLCAITWIFWFFHKTKENISIQRMIIVIFIVPLILYFITHSNSFQIFVDRIVAGDSAAGRFNGYTYLTSNWNISLSNWLFGNGMKKIPIYLAGFARVIYYYGFIGLLIFMLICVSILYRVEKSQKILLLIFLLLNLGTEVLFGPLILVYFPFILSFVKQGQKENGNGG
ncbi:hypothetical protein PH235_08340 [Trichococcus sp. K1Tr]|uniref:hypothetical protein n=1 Tax=Trichococcus sp. K1Tr TaxID=3020847 RepID=UPI0023310169|nr:hypothetical protein [Trichococcus sp. K1Tr]MDB6353566.1 hypothetical protein [Trichococcus sp. K1Tr]